MIESQTKASHNILLPVNRTSRRFLSAVNKIRRFFAEETVNCIPCVEQPFDLLLSTRKLKHHNIKIISFYENDNITGFSKKRHGIQFNGALDKRKAMLADYLRSKNDMEHNCVVLPMAISNFLNSNQVKFYISEDRRFKSLEEQREFYKSNNISY